MGRVVALAVLVIAMTAGCIEQPAPVANSSGLVPNLVQGGFDITWTGSPSGEARGYQLQYRTDTKSWTEIPTTNEPHASFTDVTEFTTYYFRVRVATAPGGTPADFSPTASGIYVVPKLPIVRVNTDGYKPIIDKVTPMPATMQIDPNGSAFDAYSGSLEIRGRGNSTWTMPKKPYKLKLKSKSKIMGMATSKHWVLLANAQDRSGLRTYGAEQIAKSTNLAWTPSFRHVELILNGQYVGVYQLAESVKPDPNRVNITEMSPTDNSGESLTGGYLLEIDDRLEENNEPGWRTPKNVPVVIKEPDPATPEQSSYIRNYVNNFENVLFSSQFQDPAAGYAAYLDVDSFIDFWIVQEATRNGDSFWSSTYFYKNRADDKLHFGPIWDFDHSLGSGVTPRPQPAEGWYARMNGAWTRKLFTDPAFVQKVAARWAELAPTLSQIPARIEALGASLATADLNDQARWNYTPAEYDTPDYVANWLTARIDWMSSAFAAESNG